MKNIHQGAIKGIVLAAAMVCAASAHADSASVYGITAQVSNLRYRLIDLNPSDGIAPSATFDTTILVGSMPWDADLAQWQSLYTGSLLPSTTITNTQNGYAEASPDGFKLVVGASSQDLASQIDPSARQWQIAAVSQYTSITSADVNAPTTPGGDYRQAFLKLGANTGIEIMGTASITGQEDMAALKDSLNSIPNVLASETQMTALSNRGARIELGLVSYADGYDGSNVSSTQSNESHFNMNGSSWGDSMDTLQPISGSRSFSLQLSNTLDAPLDVGFYLSMAAGTDIGAYVDLSDPSVVLPPIDPIDPIPGIPEPSTYALMGLGLVGISLARKRARKAD